MKLVSFKVEKFRNIVDSTSINVESDVTCLVGKNESGKTAILNALYRLNPAFGEQFDIGEHYPRWLKTKERKSGAIGDAAPIRGTFELDDEDIAAVEDALGEGTLNGRKFSFTRKYEGSNLVGDVTINEAKAIEHALSQSNASPQIKALVKDEADLKSVRALIKKKLEESQNTDAPEVDISELNAVDAAIGNQLGKRISAWGRATDILESRMPEFFYFSQYSVLPGRIDLTELDTEEDAPAQNGLQTARALLKLADTTTESLRDDDYEERKGELEAVSNSLTEQVFEYWTQNEQLEVIIDVDKKTVETPDPYGNQRQSVATYLDTRVRDKRHGFTSNFGQRSAGFQWFFSFLAAFSEFEDRKNVIVLLDEPGLALHAKAQADFLRFIDERLAPAAQVVYTTHSPFMVETAKLERVRVVEDKGTKLGTTVSSEVLTVNSDTLFPLQAALGYDIAQNLFIGPNNLLVEGTSDFTYLTVISDHLKSLGRDHLDEAWRILPSGGINNIPTFVALIGKNLDVTVLVDSGAQGMQRLTNLASAGLLNDKRLLTIGQVIGQSQADIEDLFSITDFLSLYNAAFSGKRKVLKSKLQPGTRIIDRISRTQGSAFTDHGRPADFLLRDRFKLVAKLDTETLDNFEALIRLINATRI